MNEVEALLARFSACVEGNDLGQAYELATRILESDPGRGGVLRFQVDFLISRQRFADAAARLQWWLANQDGSAERYLELGYLWESAGRLEEAGGAYRHAFEKDRDNPLVYLYLGHLLLLQGCTEQAVSLLSLGEDREPRLLAMHRDGTASDKLRERSAKAREQVNSFLTQMHLDAVGAAVQGEGLQRIVDARWPMIDTRPVNYRVARQRPNVLYIPALEASPRIPSERLPWASALESRFDEIRAEILCNMDLEADGQPYLDAGVRKLGPEWESVGGTMNWASIFLYRQGVANDAVLDKFPRVLAALEDVPLADNMGVPAEIMISVLAPQTRIPPHYGQSNYRLTVHLPIRVPPGCALRVAGERCEHVEARVLAFDDTFEHEAWNDSDEQRVVLIFETWHPDLRAEEIDALRRTLTARQRWLAQRRELLRL